MALANLCDCFCETRQPIQHLFRIIDVWCKPTNEQGCHLATLVKRGRRRINRRLLGPAMRASPAYLFIQPGGFWRRLDAEFLRQDPAESCILFERGRFFATLRQGGHDLDVGSLVPRLERDQAARVLKHLRQLAASFMVVCEHAQHFKAPVVQRFLLHNVPFIEWHAIAHSETREQIAAI